MANNNTVIKSFLLKNGFGRDETVTEDSFISSDTTSLHIGFDDNSEDLFVLNPKIKFDVTAGTTMHIYNMSTTPTNVSIVNKAVQAPPDPSKNVVSFTIKPRQQYRNNSVYWEPYEIEVTPADAEYSKIEYFAINDETQYSRVFVEQDTGRLHSRGYTPALLLAEAEPEDSLMATVAWNFGDQSKPLSDGRVRYVITNKDGSTVEATGGDLMGTLCYRGPLSTEKTLIRAVWDSVEASSFYVWPDNGKASNTTVLDELTYVLNQRIPGDPAGTVSVQSRTIGSLPVMGTAVGKIGLQWGIYYKNIDQNSYFMLAVDATVSSSVYTTTNFTIEE